MEYLKMDRKWCRYGVDNIGEEIWLINSLYHTIFTCFVSVGHGRQYKIDLSYLLLRKFMILFFFNLAATLQIWTGHLAAASQIWTRHLAVESQIWTHHLAAASRIWTRHLAAMLLNQLVTSYRPRKDRRGGVTLYSTLYNFNFLSSF